MSSYIPGHPLFILPFDHRNSFKKMFGAEGREYISDEKKSVADFKKIIYEGFRDGIKDGVPINEAAVLVDEEYGRDVIDDVLAAGTMLALTTEKSGQTEFDFMSSDFASDLNRLQPTFAKALVRYNPDGDAIVNERQRDKLRQLSEYCQANSPDFLLEVLIPSTPKQLASVDGNEDRYDKEVRPALAVRAVNEFQQAGVEPVIWKMAGFRDWKHYHDVVKQIQIDDRESYFVVLGRAANLTRVEEWVKIGASVNGVVGFAIGRTVFWQPIEDYYQGNLSKENAVKSIGEEYCRFYQLFAQSKL